MLAVLCATDGFVEFRRTIAAGHDDGLSVGVAKGLEDVVAEEDEIVRDA